MLSDSRDFVRTAPWTMFFPGMALTLTVLAFNLLGDGLRDFLDPRLRGQP
jgi:peptide/nickel transport system permease protein